MIQRWRPGASVNSGFVSDSDDIKDIEKYVDNGTNYFMCPLCQEFGNLDPVSGAVVVLADNQMVKVDARGAWHILTVCGHPFIEHNSLFVPTLGKALFSPNRLCASGRYQAVQDAKGWRLVDVQQGKVVLSASYHRNLLRIDPSISTPTANASAVKVKDTPDIIHRRFAH